VSRRTREIGIRLAIGAGRAQVLRMVLGNGLTLALTGVLLGLTLALAAARSMRSMLYGVGPADPLTFISVGITLSLVALLSSLVPAWRAMRVNPVVALKTE
jgi:putative ABC transport system permease protein